MNQQQLEIDKLEEELYNTRKATKQQQREMRRQKRDIADLQFEHGRLHSVVMYIVSLAMLGFLVWLYMSTMIG